MLSCMNPRVAVVRGSGFLLLFWVFSVQVFRGLGLRASRVKFRRSVIAGMLFSG